MKINNVMYFQLVKTEIKYLEIRFYFNKNLAELALSSSFSQELTYFLENLNKDFSSNLLLPKDLIIENKKLFNEYLYFESISNNEKTSNNEFLYPIQYIKIQEDFISIGFKKLADKKLIKKAVNLLRSYEIGDIDENPKAKDFYCKFGGDQILEQKNYPQELNQFLSEEEKFYRTFIEQNKKNIQLFLKLVVVKLEILI